MVEPDQVGIKAGMHNFQTNGFEGDFINEFVQAGGFEVDKHMERKGLRHLDILHADIQGYELQMLQGARNTLGRKQIDYVFVSTHSQELHEQVCHVLASFGYRVEVEADFDSETTSMDGFVFATSPIVPPVFRSFKPLGRLSIASSKPESVFEYLEKVRSCINPTVASSNLFLREVSGVIHVGANTGQERYIYSAYGLSVLWVEPIAEIFAALEANIQGVSGQIALNALVADVNGKEYDLHIANNGGTSSSIFELKQHKELWPEVDYVSKVRCESITLPTLLEKAGVNVGKYDALVLDTQGSELLVLKGASSLLQGFKFIKVEVPDFESYEGCCRDSDVSSFMSEHSFEEIFRSRFAGQSGTGSYFDVVYKRRS
jgi:FkbM family methyltransferase